MREIRPEPGMHRFPPHMLDVFPAEAGAWYERAEEVRRGLANGDNRARLIMWVRKKMPTHLSRREAQCVELYYLAAWNQPAIAAHCNCHVSTVCRNLRRAVRKLRKAAQEDRSWEPYARDRKHPPTDSGERE